MLRAYWAISLLAIFLLAIPAAWNVYTSVVAHDWQASSRFDGQAYIASTRLDLPDLTAVELDGTAAARVLATLAVWEGVSAGIEEVAERLGGAGSELRLSDFSDAAAGYGLHGHWLRAEPAALSHIKTPFVAHMKDDGGRFVIVRDVRGGYVYAADPTRGQVLYPFENFTAAWAGHILAFSDPPAQPEEWR